MISVLMLQVKVMNLPIPMMPMVTMVIPQGMWVLVFVLLILTHWNLLAGHGMLVWDQMTGNLINMLQQLIRHLMKNIGC